MALDLDGTTGLSVANLAQRSIEAILSPYTIAGAPDKGRLSEPEFSQISQALSQLDKEPWSRVPRLYAVLYMIKSVHVIDAFVSGGISDLWFPFSHRTLPECLRNSSARFAFLDFQKYVLTKASDLEREDGRHRHFSTSKEIPLLKLQELGKGGFGSVDKVLSTITYKEYARKLIPRGKTFRKNAEVLRDFVEELGHLKRLSHSHIVELVGSYTDPTFVGILMSPVAHCNLKEFLERNSLSSAEKSFLRTFYGCLASALCYLHKNQVRHKDIKPQNVLVKGHQVFLTDFGISLDWSELGHSTTTGVTTRTLRYCAPETGQYLPRNSLSDVWSLGCVFLEIWTVLKGETTSRLLNFMSDRGSKSTCYHLNQESAILWCTDLEAQRVNIDENPAFPWIVGCLQPDQEARWTAEKLFDCITEAVDDPNHRYRFSGTCCIEEDGSDGSEISSKRSSQCLDDTGLSNMKPYEFWIPGFIDSANVPESSATARPPRSVGVPSSTSKIVVSNGNNVEEEGASRTAYKRPIDRIKSHTFKTSHSQMNHAFPPENKEAVQFSPKSDISKPSSSLDSDATGSSSAYGDLPSPATNSMVSDQESFGILDAGLSNYFTLPNNPNPKRAGVERQLAEKDKEYQDRVAHLKARWDSDRQNLLAALRKEKEEVKRLDQKAHAAHILEVKYNELNQDCISLRHENARLTQANSRLDADIVSRTQEITTLIEANKGLEDDLTLGTQQHSQSTEEFATLDKKSVKLKRDWSDLVSKNVWRDMYYARLANEEKKAREDSVLQMEENTRLDKENKELKLELIRCSEENGNMRKEKNMYIKEHKKVSDSYDQARIDDNKTIAWQKQNIEIMVKNEKGRKDELAGCYKMIVMYNQTIDWQKQEIKKLVKENTTLKDQLASYIGEHRNMQPKTGEPIEDYGRLYEATISARKEQQALQRLVDSGTQKAIVNGRTHHEASPAENIPQMNNIMGLKDDVRSWSEDNRTLSKNRTNSATGNRNADGASVPRSIRKLFRRKNGEIEWPDAPAWLLEG